MTRRIVAGWEGRFFEDFEVGDVYRCRIGRTDHDHVLGVSQCLLDGVAKVGSGREIIAVTENRTDAGRHLTCTGRGSDQLTWHAVGLERSMQPGCPSFITVAIADIGPVLVIVIHRLTLYLR